MISIRFDSPVFALFTLSILSLFLWPLSQSGQSICLSNCPAVCLFVYLFLSVPQARKEQLNLSLSPTLSLQFGCPPRFLFIEDKTVFIVLKLFSDTHRERGPENEEGKLEMGRGRVRGRERGKGTRTQSIFIGNCPRVDQSEKSKGAAAKRLNANCENGSRSRKGKREKKQKQKLRRKCVLALCLLRCGLCGLWA